MKFGSDVLIYQRRCLFLMGQTRPLFVYFRPVLDAITNFEQYLIGQKCESIDGVLGIRTRDCNMVGAHKSTELWRPHDAFLFEGQIYQR